MALWTLKCNFFDLLYANPPPTWFHTTHHREFSASLVTCSDTFFGRSGGMAWFRPYKVHRFLTIWVIPTPTYVYFEVHLLQFPLGQIQTRGQLGSRCLIPFFGRRNHVWWVYPVPPSGGKSRRMREPQFTGIVGLHTKVVDMFPLFCQNVNVSILIFPNLRRFQDEPKKQSSMQVPPFFLKKNIPLPRADSWKKGRQQIKHKTRRGTNLWCPTQGIRS